jgi:hypothetical protein
VLSPALLRPMIPSVVQKPQDGILGLATIGSFRRQASAIRQPS